MGEPTASQPVAVGRVGFALLLVLTATASRSVAQSLPLLHPINPVAESRTGLYFQPYVAAAPRWRVALGVDYGSMVELGFRSSLADTSYLLDAEVLRVNLSATKDLGPRRFVVGEVWAGGSYPGFLDGFLNWYHGIFGIRFPEREDRPHGHFDYYYKFPNGRVVRFGPKDFGIGDLRLGIGQRHSDRAQSVLSLTLPTNTMGQGYKRGTLSLSLLNTLRAPVTPRLVYEGSANVGFAPRHGPLSALQNRFFFLGTSGIRWRTTGGLWTFGNLFLHSPYYSAPGTQQLDGWDLTVDFGWIIRSRSGREFRFGMTEDLWPSGPAVDADFRVGMSW
jgi:hypothetical protein